MDDDPKFDIKQETFPRVISHGPVYTVCPVVKIDGNWEWETYVEGGETYRYKRQHLWGDRVLKVKFREDGDFQDEKSGKKEVEKVMEEIDEEDIKKMVEEEDLEKGYEPGGEAKFVPKENQIPKVRKAPKEIPIVLPKRLVPANAKRISKKRVTFSPEVKKRK